MCPVHKKFQEDGEHYRGNEENYDPDARAPEVAAAMSFAFASGPENRASVFKLNSGCLPRGERPRPFMRNGGPVENDEGQFTGGRE